MADKKRRAANIIINDVWCWFERKTWVWPRGCGRQHGRKSHESHKHLLWTSLQKYRIIQQSWTQKFYLPYISENTVLASSSLQIICNECGGAQKYGQYMIPTRDSKPRELWVCTRCECGTTTCDVTHPHFKVTGKFIYDQSEVTMEQKLTNHSWVSRDWNEWTCILASWSGVMIHTHSHPRGHKA